MGKANYTTDPALDMYQKNQRAGADGVDAASKLAQSQVKGAAGQQLNNNRLDTSNPFASQTFNADGSVSQQFTGGMGQAFDGLQGQVAGLGKGMDWGQFGELGNGDAAREQAINAGYGAATSRLDPMWNQREAQARTRLLNQGLDENSEAFKNAMGEMGNQRTDAYNQAMFSAIGQGREAGDSVFRNNMSSRQQAIQEALKARGMPLEELEKMQGFLSGQPQYNQDSGTLAAAMAGGQMGTGAAQNRQGLAQQQFDNRFAMLKGEQSDAAGAAQGGASAAASLAAFLPLMFSDERLKSDIVRGPDVIPGVPSATWKWNKGGEPGSGVIAQDLQKVRPDLVRVDEKTGFLMVNYEGLRGAK